MSRAIHQAFTWVEDTALDREGAEFAALTYDVCVGVRTCLQLVHSTDLNNSGGGAEDPPILGHIDKERVLLLATAAMRMLGDRAEARVDFLNRLGREATRPREA